MSNEITSTNEIAETEWNGQDEPGDVQTDMVATHEPEGRGIEFHVSMRDYTQHDMEALIVEAAARMLVGKHNNNELAKKIEAKCIELVTAKAGRALETVTSEIIDQPMTPTYAWVKDKTPVTMREFIGLTGREFLTQSVDSNDQPSTSGYHTQRRIDRIVQKYMDIKFKTEIEKATNAAIGEIRAAVKARHDAILAAETARIREAIAKVVPA